MELRIPSPEELELLYNRDMKEAFPEDELRPLASIMRMWKAGKYAPYCLFNGDDPVGTAFMVLGHPGWALVDYLCVSPRLRNGGVGASILSQLTEMEPETVFFGEVEVPEDAPDPEMARRRLAFYARCGLRTAGYETEIFGVHYKTLYLANREVEDATLMEEHDFAYRDNFTPEKYDRYVRIPYRPDAVPGEKVPWSDD